MARLSESLLFRMLSVGWPSTLPEIQCHVNKRKTNQRYRAKGFQCFPLRPGKPRLAPRVPPSPQPPGQDTQADGGTPAEPPGTGTPAEAPAWAMPLGSHGVSLLCGSRDGRAGQRSFPGAGEKGGPGRGVGTDSKVTSAVLVSHFLLCKFRRAGSVFPFFKKYSRKVSVRRI